MTGINNKFTKISIVGNKTITTTKYLQSTTKDNKTIITPMCLHQLYQRDLLINFKRQLVNSASQTTTTTQKTHIMLLNSLKRVK